MCLNEKPQAIRRLGAVSADTSLARLFLGELLLSSAASASPDGHFVSEFGGSEQATGNVESTFVKAEFSTKKQENSQKNAICRQSPIAQSEVPETPEIARGDFRKDRLLRWRTPLNVPSDSALAAKGWRQDGRGMPDITSGLLPLQLLGPFVKPCNPYRR